jgi:hypothetical protein
MVDFISLREESFCNNISFSEMLFSLKIGLLEMEAASNYLIKHKYGCDDLERFLYKMSLFEGEDWEFIKKSIILSE